MWCGRTFEVSKPMTIGGVVTSSDVAGNFYQTFTIEDATGAVEIMAGMRDLHNPYPVGCRLYIDLEGCAVGLERGVLQVGLMPASYSNYAVDYFYSKVLLDNHIVRSGDMETVAAKVVGYAELAPERCGSLVQIRGLQYVADEADALDEAAWSGYRAFADRNGNRIFTYTSDYASFAAESLPTEMCDITGILQYGVISGESGEWFILKMRSRDDCVSSVSSSL